MRSAGYFGSEAPESNIWKSLENKAATAYINSRKEEYVNAHAKVSSALSDQPFSDVTRPSFASKMNTALRTASDIDLSVCAEEEPDNWLDIDAENFDSMLQTVTPGKSNGISVMDVDRNGEQLAQDQASKLKSLAQRVEEFVEGEGDLEGARFEEYVTRSNDASSSAD